MILCWLFLVKISLYPENMTELDTVNLLVTDATVRSTLVEQQQHLCFLESQSRISLFTKYMRQYKESSLGADRQGQHREL